MHEPARCRGGRRGHRQASMREETLFRVTNSRYHANPSSDPVFFRRRCNDLTFQRITTASPSVKSEDLPHFPI
jgi:hypothetical protein